LHHEVYVYIFDALLMFVTMTIFNIVHPQDVGKLLRRASDYELTCVPEA
jgi:hypothetical protein